MISRDRSVLGGRSRLGSLVFLMALLLSFAAAARSQQLSGSVQGTVSDISGGTIPGAAVELTGVDNSITRTQKSGPDGRYYFAAVTPGRYTLKASLASFNTTTRRVDVELNRIARVDIVLTVGDVKTTIEVTAGAQTVDTASTNVSTNIGSKVVTDLPFLTRDITRLVELAPGTRHAEGTTAGGSQVVDLSGNYAQGGGTRRSQSVFYMDGSDNMGGWRNQAMQMPNPDAVSEVQVISSSASAEFGKQPGISVNAITKSGTNDLHGTASYAFHWDRLNANTWNANRNGAPRPPDKQKWFTGTLGGPVVRNRTFFFLSYQRFQDENPGEQSSSRMPTPEMVRGDFSAIPQFNIALKDPATNQPIGNVIPQRLINPIAAELASRFPTIPEYSNDPALGRLFWQFVRSFDNNEGLAKIDHKLSDNQQLSVSYMTTEGGQSRPDNVSGLTNNVAGWGGTTVTGARQHTLSGRHTWTIGPSAVVESRGAFSRLYSTRGRTEEENLGTLGAPWPEVRPGAHKTLPTITLTGGPTGRGGQYSDLAQQNFRGLSTVSWYRGRHLLKFGGEAQYNQYSRLINYDNGRIAFTGTYSFTGGSLNGPWPSLKNPSGDLRFAYSWADFLLGRLNSFEATGVQDAAYSGLASYYFAQDEWRLHDNVTLTAGLRYELYGTQKSANRLASYMEGFKSSLYPNAPVGVAFEGDAGVPTGIRTPDRNNVAPRLGVAWDALGSGRLVVRGGSGIYYAYPPLSVIEQIGANLNAPTFSGGHASLSDPWATSRSSSNSTACQFSGCAPPSFSSDPNLRSWSPANIYGFSSDAATPYQLQFNGSVETRVVKDLTVQAAYVGNRAKKGWAVRDQNLALWQANANTGNVNPRRPNQLFRQINLLSSDTSENYNAGQFIVTYARPRLWARFTLSMQEWLTTAGDQNQEVGINNSPANWTSDPRNIAADWASVIPSRQMRGFVIYDLPAFGNAWTKKYLGGWQVANTWSYFNGDRLNVNLGTDANFDGFSPDRPDLNGKITYPRAFADGVTTWFLPGTFTAPPAPSAENPYPFGNVPRNAVRGPGRLFMDASVSKTTPLTERFRVQLRLDFDNVLNHPYLSNPNVVFGNSDFGLIRTKDGGGRTAQVYLKLIF